MNLAKSAIIAAAADVEVTPVTRYDINVATGINHAADEYHATNLVIGLHHKANIIDSFFGNLTEGVLKGSYREILIARYMIPPTSVRKIHVAVPPQAEYEAGFVKWIEHLGRMASQLACGICFYANETTLGYIEEVVSSMPAAGLAYFLVMEEWGNFEQIKAKMHHSHLVVVVGARKCSITYNSSFEKLPSLLAANFSGDNLIVLYPEQHAQHGNN